MCHNCVQHATAKPSVMVMARSGTTTQTKSTFRLSPFRKVAKSARINLNRYWGLLSTKLNNNKPSAVSEESSLSFHEAMEQNRINELLEEAHARATSQNSFNSQIEEDFFYNSNSSVDVNNSNVNRPILWQHSPSGSPQPIRMLVRQPQRSLGSVSAASQQSFEFDDSLSQDSVFL